MCNPSGVSLKPRPPLGLLVKPRPSPRAICQAPPIASGYLSSPAHCLGHNRKVPPPVRRDKIEENREKALKWSKNDQFRQIHFLNKQFWYLNYTSIDAEWQKTFFEITCRFVTGFVLELLTKNASKNRRPNFADPWPLKMSISLPTQNLTNYTSIDAKWQ